MHNDLFVLNFVEIEVETSASQVDEERREQQEDVNMSEQRETSEREGEHGHANEEEQEQQGIVKFACDLDAVGEEEQRNGVRVQVKKMSEDKVAEEPSQAEDEEEMTVSTTRESPKKGGKASEVIELALKMMCGGGGEGGSTDKSGDCMDVDVDEGDEKEVEMKAVTMPAVRVSCIQWAGKKRKLDGEEGGRKEDTLQRQPSPIPSTSAAFLATIKTSSLPASPVFFKHEWANEDEEGMGGDGQQDESFQEGINNISFVAGEVGPTPPPPPPPPPIQTNVGASSSQSQLQGSVSSLLTALQNPAGNTVLPCCCCVHPCCIVMSKPVVLILLIN